MDVQRSGSQGNVGCSERVRCFPKKFAVNSRSRPQGCQKKTPLELFQRRLEPDPALRMPQAEEYGRVGMVDSDAGIGATAGSCNIKPGIRCGGETNIQRISLLLENPAEMRRGPADGQRAATEAEGDVGGIIGNRVRD